MASTNQTRLQLPFQLSKQLGQGVHPELELLYSTDDASADTPSWVRADGLVRAFSTSRGRNSERDDVEAGTASTVLDNRERDFDPTVNTALRPMNRWWLRASFNGAKYDLFKGYAESYDQQWPAGGFDSVTIANHVDEFKVLALDKLLTTDPPRDTYADVIIFDKPSGYWRMDEPDAVSGATATVGQNLILTGTATLDTPAAIVGDPGTYLRLAAAAALYTSVSEGESGDVTGLGEFAIELWFRFPSNPAANRDIILGPQANTLSTYSLKLLTTGALQVEARNSAGTNHTTATSALLTNTWYHVVGTINDGFLRIYINGAQANSTAWTGAFHGTLGASDNFTIGSTATAEAYEFDEVATYRYGLPASRISAHYTAGAQRGFAKAFVLDDRVDAILDSAGSSAPRAVFGTDNINYEYAMAFMHGQPPLEEIRETVSVAPPAIFFASKSGVLTTLNPLHRAASPYNTVQAVFGDAGGTEIPYTEIDVDYSDAFLFNEFIVTREGGLPQTASDATSIARYLKRSQSLGLRLLASDSLALDLAVALLAKYKDPSLRVLSLTVNTADPDGAEAALSLDLGDRIEVRRTPPGGGARIEEELFVQSIAWNASAASPVWTLKLGVSPL